MTEGHERSSLFLRKFRPAHSHHNASASWHESAATRMQMFATGSNLTAGAPSYSRYFPGRVSGMAIHKNAAAIKATAARLRNPSQWPNV